MGWQFPYVSTCKTDFAFDYGLALTEEQATSADPSSTIPTPVDYGRPPARNSKTEGRGFESFRPCQFPFLRAVIGFLDGCDQNNQFALWVA